MNPPIIWQPHAPTLALVVALLAAIALVVLRARRLRARFGVRAAVALATPVAVVGALLVAALYDPSLPARSTRDRTLLVLVDQSSSMDVRDGAETRRQRAERIAAALAPAGAKVERRWFDSAVHDAPAPTGDAVRGTDLAACLQSLAPTVASGDVAGIVVVGDGGDEAVHADGLPAAPIAAIAVGADPAGLDDVAIAAVEAPDSAEKDLDLELAVDVVASGSTVFRERLGVVPATLSIAAGDQWRELARQPLDLAHGRARATFRTKPEAPGSVRYRIAIPVAAGEVSALDNQREVVVDVRERALHVLYFSRTLGLDFKPLRAELGRDPGLALTALYRTVGARLGGGGERFTVQGDRLAGDDDLDGGFPAEAAALARYDVIILGSFAADGWSEAQQRALCTRVENGGAVVLLGGEKSFGCGGYAATPLAPLMPWQVAPGEPVLARGDFVLAVPAAAASHPVLAGVPERLAQARGGIASANRPGPLRAGALALLTAAVDGGEVAVVATMPYGKGRVLGIATDTLWRIARGDDAGGGAYGLFWRQALRWLADRGEGGGGLRVRWDRARYRPGETAVATVRVEVPGRTRLSATVERAGERHELPAVAAPGEEGALRLDVPFGARGEHRVRIVATRDDGGADSYERVFDAQPLLPEGARLGRDDAGLKALTEAHGGVCVGEDHVADLTPWLANACRPRSVGAARSLVFASPWWLIALLAALLTDWTLRRKRNLL